ncbi:hypothetical protein C8Q74DRAFT_1243056 [Fomes fomentarius]|nr:hypothetical protein C8Q74DRAFT_1243056 [Fomes fomentarius]
MTSMVFFKRTKRVGARGRRYLLTTKIGPKLAITEVKSFKLKDEDSDLDNVLDTVLEKAHVQNERAAMWLFGEDNKLQQIASFVGAGPAWSYGEFDRMWYHDVHGQTWPKTAREVEEFEDRDILKMHRKERKRRPLKKRKVARSDSFGDSEFDNADYEPDSDPSSDSVDNAPTMDGGVNDHRIAAELGAHTRLPAPILAELFGDRTFLYILDEEGRTRQAFDIIVDRIRGWYKDRTDEYRLNFDADPHTP